MEGPIMRRLCLVLVLLASTGLARAGEMVTLTTLEWCPYTCEALPDGGFSAVVVREAFRAVETEVRFRFLPWPRAIRAAQTDPTVAGVFPAYERELGGFSLSASIGEGPLGLIQPPAAAPPSPTPDGLGRLRIGVVNGYGTSRPLETAMAAGTLNPQMVLDDAAGVRMVALGRLDAAEIDRHVFAWLIRNREDLRSLAGRVVFGTTLEMKTLHVAFAGNPRGRVAEALFAEGLRRIDVPGLQRRYFEAAGR
jgi:polar amino acid transport system substrate-binding protein